MKTEINGYFCQKQLAYHYQTGKLPLEKKKQNRYKYTKKSPHTYHYREENTEIDSDYNKVNKNIVVFSFFRSVFNSNSSSQTRKISPYNSFNNLKNNLQFRMCTSI